MAVIHISEADAARDFAGLMVHVRAGAQVVIENGTHPVAIVQAPLALRRSLSESISMAEAHSHELGYAPVMDESFAADMEAIIADRKPRDTAEWD